MTVRLMEKLIYFTTSKLIDNAIQAYTIQAYTIQAYTIQAYTIQAYTIHSIKT